MIRFKPFQLEDYARAALHDGLILAHATGLGKGVAAFAWPLLKCGFTAGPHGPAVTGRVLLIVPGNLHEQVTREARHKFGITLTRLDSLATYRRLCRKSSFPPSAFPPSALPPGFYLSSYTEVATNGVGKFYGAGALPDPTVGESKVVGTRYIKCVGHLSLADQLMADDAFDCVVVDEGVKMKGAETGIGLGIRQLCPKYRMVLTATPIKNRLPDIFWLAWWAAGGRTHPHARFPYEGTIKDQALFAEAFLVVERNLTKEALSQALGKPRRYRKLSAEVCNVHGLWKLLGPLVLRRRKEDCGEDIVQKHRHVIRVPMGTEQAQVYRYHLQAQYKDVNNKRCVVSQLQALRVAAANPCSALLHSVKDAKGLSRSRQPHTPKTTAALSLIAQLLERDEQLILFSAFQDGLDMVAARLREAGVSFALADGRESQAQRGRLAEQFKARRFPVLLAGLDSMGEGGDFPMAKNVACLAWTWAWDKLEQAMNRVHRITSPEDVHFYGLICDGSIDRRLEDLWHEKGESQELVLDGKLLGEGDHEVNLAELLHTAVAEFDPASRTVCEKKLSAEWPQLQQQLRAAAARWTAGRESCSQLPEAGNQPTHEQTQTPPPPIPELALPEVLAQPDLPGTLPPAHPPEAGPMPDNIVVVDFRTPYVNPISAAWRKQMTVAKLATPRF